MPKVTKITKQKKRDDRYNIFIDDVFSGGLNAETMVVHGIKENSEIDIEEFNEIIKEDNQKYAFNLALKYISYRRRTVSETEKYLLSKELASSIVSSALNKVLDYGYLNDEDYAKEFVRYHINAAKFGRIVLTHKMKEKGFTENIIDNAMALYTDEAEHINAGQLYEKLMKKYINIDPLKRREKIFRSLAGKGFSYDIITALLSGEEDR